MAAAVTDQLKKGFKRIDQSYIPGKCKVLCYQFMVYQWVYQQQQQIIANIFTKLDAKTNNYIWNWLGLPRFLLDAALFGRDVRQLPLKNISFGYRLEKTRPVLQLRQSSDQLFRNASTKIPPERAWKAGDCVDNAISRIKQQELVRRTQQGRCGLGCKPLVKNICKRTTEVCWLTVTEVTRMEGDTFLVKC